MDGQASFVSLCPHLINPQHMNNNHISLDEIFRIVHNEFRVPVMTPTKIYEVLGLVVTCDIISKLQGVDTLDQFWSNVNDLSDFYYQNGKPDWSQMLLDMFIYDNDGGIRHPNLEVVFNDFNDYLQKNPIFYDWNELTGEYVNERMADADQNFWDI